MNKKYIEILAKQITKHFDNFGWEEAKNLAKILKFAASKIINKAQNYIQDPLEVLTSIYFAIVEAKSAIEKSKNKNIEAFITTVVKYRVMDYVRSAKAKYKDIIYYTSPIKNEGNVQDTLENTLISNAAFDINKESNRIEDIRESIKAFFIKSRNYIEITFIRLILKGYTKTRASQLIALKRRASEAIISKLKKHIISWHN
ncbi:hypothetical protein SHELI_v1c00320 [Spiroplasma helicoides]|uniref:Uncharacterized protein n=1 Tax=Spiroplasma helicoides TaxID=216938 RepID=A0A1B3SJ92_9MOLU|nr:hypothetical protein [Spiroplasma helicoides]AOG59987.1 hypothetical protein SHELI_v1c00320 [Spiroplasma helicoides]